MNALDGRFETAVTLATEAGALSSVFFPGAWQRRFRQTVSKAKKAA
jgi:hypothetical protein